MKHITIVIPNGYAELSSIRGSYEILNSANQYWQQMGHGSLLTLSIAGFISELNMDEGFFTIHPTNINAIEKTHLVIIPSIAHHYVQSIANNQQLVEWIVKQYKAGAEIASICTGTFLLAATGLLEGKTCSTHWGAADDFKRMFPTIDLDADKLITEDKGIYTNGGSYSFLNLILLLVEKYFDRATAVYCSKMFQIDIDRTSQSPFVIFETQKLHGDEVIIKAQTYIENNLSEKISFEQLSDKLAVSRRNFDRRFIKATGNTPVEYLQRVKVEAAKTTLEKGRKTIFEVMSDVGYSDDKAFRAVFKKITGMSPLSYREKFSKEAVFV